MPSSDLILNVRQITGYPPAANVTSSDAILIQRGGLGGPYMSIDVADFVGTALAQGGDMAVGGRITVPWLQAGSAQVSNISVGSLNAQAASILNLTADWGLIPTLTSDSASIATANVGTLNVAGDMRLGGVANLAAAVVQTTLSVGGLCAFGSLDVLQTLSATNLNVSSLSNLCNVVVNGNLAVPYGTATVGGHPIVTTGNVGGSGLAPLNSPAFTGDPTAPTPVSTDNSTALATTAFVITAVNGALGYVAPLASPNFSGVPAGPTAAPGTSTPQLATTAFVQAAIADATAGVSSFNTRTGAVTFQSGDLTAVGGALLASPAFTGTPTGPTAGAGVSTTQLATTAFVQSAVQALNVGVTTFNTRSGAVSLTTADIMGAGGALAIDAGVTTFNGRSGAITLTANDVTAAGALANPSPALTGTPSAPTAAASTSTTQLATTAFVQAAIASMNAGVTTFNGRSGAVSLTTADLTSAGGALLASPAFTGAPTAPTATAGASTTQIATTAFVTSAIAAGVAGVSSFNTRTGAVTLTSTDITNAGGALSSQAGVSSFNGRTGAITFAANDLSAVGGALLASPVFTGSPSVPTATAGTSTTQAASTAFVQNGLSGYLPLAGGAISGALNVSGVLTAAAAGTRIVNSLFNANGVYHQVTADGRYWALGWNNATAGINFFLNGNNTGYMSYSNPTSGNNFPIISWFFQSNPAPLCSITVPGSAWYWNVTSSDRRLKSNIGDATIDALDIVNRLPVHEADLGYPYDGSPPPQHWDCTLIADEVAGLVPRSYVKAPTADTYDTIEPLALVATLVRAMQQLTARVVQLETRPAT